MDIENVKDAIDLLQKGINKLSNGPLSYYVENMVAAYDILMTRYAPFKVGDCVLLTKTPVINLSTASGWMGSKHFLVKGAAGTVATADCGTRGFKFDVIFDDESWYNHVDKIYVKMAEDKRHRYCFGEDDLVKIPKHKQ